jgi:hypothetical protein
MMLFVRTTVTLDPDTEAMVRRRMRERGISFKRALNDSIREGARATESARPFTTATAPLGLPTVDLDRALRVAADIEDEELVRKMRLGK